MEILKAPAKVFLQIDDSISDGVDFNELYEVTWSADHPINDNDLCYVPEDDLLLAQSRIAELEAREERILGLLEKAFRRHNHGLCKFFGDPCDCDTAWQQYKQQHNL